MKVGEGVGGGGEGNDFAIGDAKNCLISRLTRKASLCYLQDRHFYKMEALVFKDFFLR